MIADEGSRPWRKEEEVVVVLPHVVVYHKMIW